MNPNHLKAGLAFADILLALLYTLLIHNHAIGLNQPFQILIVFSLGLFLQIILAGFYRPARMNCKYLILLIVQVCSFVLLPRFALPFRIALLILHIITSAVFFLFFDFHPSFSTATISAEERERFKKTKKYFGYGVLIGICFIAESRIVRMVCIIALAALLIKQKLR